MNPSDNSNDDGHGHHATSRDRDLGQRLQQLTVPHHRSDFWSDLTAQLENDGAADGDARQRTAPLPASTPTRTFDAGDITPPPTSASVIDLASRRRPSGRGLLAAAAAVAILAGGVALWQRQNTSDFIGVADQPGIGIGIGLDESGPDTEGGEASADTNAADALDDASFVIEVPGIVAENLETGTITFTLPGSTTPLDVVAMYPVENIDNQLVGKMLLDDGRSAVVYEHIEFVPDASPEGAVTIFAQPIEADGTMGPAIVLEQRQITGIDASWMYTEGLVQFDEGQIWVQRSFNQGACYWVDVLDLAGNPLTEPANNYPRPDGDLNEMSFDLREGSADGAGSSCPSFTPIMPLYNG